MLLRLLLFLVAGLLYLHAEAAESMSAFSLCSTASDPDAIVENCVNVINGDYCEAVTDLIIAGPDPLTVQRFHNSKNYITGRSYGGWRIFPQILLVLGKDPQKKESNTHLEPDRQIPDRQINAEKTVQEPKDSMAQIRERT